MNSGMFKVVFVVVIVGIVMTLGINIISSAEIDYVHKCKVLDLQQQQIISGDKESMYTDIRYLIITDKETFICENSVLNMKFNNSDIFFRLKKDSTYSFKVCGFRKTMVTNYRNILEVIK